MTRREFGRRLRKARKALGLSLRGLAGRVGFSHVYLFDVEKGHRLPSRETVDSIAEIIGSDSIVEDWFSVHIAEANETADEWREARERWRLSHMS
jgi:transcriptional regulator with XRE-family HTH domain